MRTGNRTPEDIEGRYNALQKLLRKRKLSGGRTTRSRARHKLQDDDLSDVSGNSDDKRYILMKNR